MVGRVFIWHAVGAAVALGCSCSGTSEPCIEFAQVQTVFVGTATNVSSELMPLDMNGRKILRQMQRVTFEVHERFKGLDANQIEVFTGGGPADCGWRFRAGTAYLVYGYLGSSTAGLETDICSRTAPVDRAEDDLAYLRSLRSRGPEGKVFGHIKGLYPREGQTRGGPIRVPVSLRSQSQTWKTLTDSRGDYSFEGIPPGKYGVSVEMPPKRSGGEPREISLSSQACVNVPFYATELGSISGVILDVRGRPAARILVSIQRSRDAVSTVVRRGSTNARGEYRIDDIPQGRYLVSAIVPSSTSSTGNETSYYPGAVTPDLARSVTVTPSEWVTNISWSIGVQVERSSTRRSPRRVGKDRNPQ